MPAMSRGSLSAPAKPQYRVAKRVKGGTRSTKNHTYESFAQRISKLKIEPIRRGRNTIIDDAELDATFSYFREALVEWRDINLSEVFTAFARRVNNLCESLPQLLHNDERIFALLMGALEKRDENSAQPLLKLLESFAHDLGARFEKHFHTAVQTVASLAATHAHADVIEWSFTCLAWLFKYLSRLLVPDLRPVFDLMVPLLGKARQKLFVMRFAAESLSFLIRKAGAAYHRDKAPLQTITAHISRLMEEAPSTDFRQGVMFCLADAIKGIQRGIHSSAVAIVQELLLRTFDDEHAQLESPPLEPILVGVVTSVIHHCDADGFLPILTTILETVESKSTDIRYLGLSSRLLFVVCSVRKSSRVSSSWPGILEAMGLMVNKAVESAEANATHIQQLLATLAVVFQYCPIDAAIPSTKLLELTSKGSLQPFFLSFCNMFALLGGERFNALFLSYFKRWSSQKAHEYGSQLAISLPILREQSIIAKESLPVPSSWIVKMSKRFEQLENAESIADDLEQVVFESNAYLNAIGSVVISAEKKKSISKCLYNILAASVESSAQLPILDTFAAGNGFLYLAQNEELQESLVQLWPALCAKSSEMRGNLPFFKSLLLLAEKNKGGLDFTGSHVEPLKKALISCLGSPSHELRLVALGLFELLAIDTEEQRNAINIASIIEQTPINLETQRSISMRTNTLAKLYPGIASDQLIGEAIPSFLFGLLHVRLASVWDDVCSALKVICETKEGEGHVLRLAIEWIGQENVVVEEPVNTSTEPPPPPRWVSEFECTNVMSLEQTINKSQAMLNDTEEQLRDRFERDHTSVQLLNAFSRTQALRVLNTLPAVAEKRSRVLVPVLLEWASVQRPTEVSVDDAPAEEAPEEDNRWTRKDLKALLTLFAAFQNAKVLYKAQEVYQALLSLLGNGDVDVQRAALQALFAYKEPAILAHKEKLLNLLDDAQFRDQVTEIFEGTVKEDHRDVLIPVLLRLLYGRVISGKKGLDVKRRAVFQALTRDSSMVRQFLEIALGPLSGIRILSTTGALTNESVLKADLLAARKQVGLIHMIEDLLSALKITIRPFVDSLVDPILFCLINATRALASDSEDENNQTSIYRSIRQRALHALNVLFESSPEYAWTPYASIIVAELVSPRLEKLPIESSHSVSGLLKLFAAWAKSASTASFLVINPGTLTKVTECLVIPSAKDEVKQFVLDSILREAIRLAVAPEGESTETKIQRQKIISSILQPYANTILVHVGALLRQSPTREVLESGVHTVAELAPHIVGSTESRSLVEVSSFLLKQPSQRVNAATKMGLLKILHEFIPRCQDDDMEELFTVVFESAVPLFAYMKDRNARDLLCSILEDLAQYRHDLTVISPLCQALNSYSTSRLDEPDFDRIAEAFATITTGSQFNLLQWKPLLYNMLFHVKNKDELSIRVNAGLALRHFIKTIGQDDINKEFISSTIIPGIQFGLRDDSELVRIEFLSVLGQLVETFQGWAPVADLHILSGAEGLDDEASFFTNILHIQSHRRLRALRRLATLAPQLAPGNIYHIMIPLLEHFVFNKADDGSNSESANALSGETGKTITSLCLYLDWPQYRSLLRRYIGYLSSKEDMQKTVIKLLSGLFDSLNRAGKSKGYVSSVSPDIKTTEAISEAAPSNDTTPMDIDEPSTPPVLAKGLPSQEKLAQDLTTNILPPLQDFLRKKDDSTVSLRVPVAIAVCKALLLLPPTEVEARLPAVLLDISYILKSKDQGSRDQARNTLCEIAIFTGASYLGFILRALRIALARGYQLHVLSFTMHSILVKFAEQQLSPGELDYCIPEMVDVIMDDTFGVTGQEKDAEEYISKMKEVRSSKSFDSMDIIARNATPSHLIQLVAPVQSLLSEKLSPRMVTKIDELLRRIGIGLLNNPTVASRDILTWCFELIQESYKNKNTEKVEHVDARNRKFLINMKYAAKSGTRHATALYTHKMIKFSLDILRTVLRKHEELQTPQNLAGFLPVIGDALVAGQEEVAVAAIRLLSNIIKTPMKELDTNASTYVTEAVRFIRGAPSSLSELSQASLKLISSILRERPNVQIREQDLAFLLKRVSVDVDEPDRQGIIFGFLKAIINHKPQIVIAEVYEVMDRVAAMMITNQTRSARDLGRSLYFNFLTDYPQAKKRFSKQLEYLIRNLQYQHVEGRQSVMEALSLILNKVGEALDEHLGMLFLPLVHSMANDDNADCRTMAGALVKALFERANPAQLKSFASDLKQWLAQDEDVGLKRLGIQCWGLYLEVTDAKSNELEFVVLQLQATLETCLERRDEEDWELIYYSLVVFSKLTKPWADYTLSSDQEAIWESIWACVSYPHTWVKVTAAKLIGIFFADLSSQNKESGLESVPLSGSRDLELPEEAMIKLTHAFLRNLEMPGTNPNEDLCIQSVRNLAFLARCFAANGVKWNLKKADATDADVDAASSAEEEEEEEEAEASNQPKSTPHTALHRLLTRLSGLIRLPTKIHRLPSLHPKSASLTLLLTLTSALPIPSLLPSLPHLLTTLSTLTDPATTVPRSTDPSFNDTYTGLIDKGREVMSTLQKRMGTKEYLEVMGGVQKGVRERREERRGKRRVEGVVDAERVGREKRRRNEVKRVKRKEKGEEFRGRRRGW